MVQLTTITLITLLQALVVSAGKEVPMAAVVTAAPCDTVSEFIDICESLSPGFENMDATDQAPCLCYSSTAWAPAIFDGYVASCVTYAMTALPGSAYKAAVALEGFCTDVGNVKMKRDFDDMTTEGGGGFGTATGGSATGGSLTGGSLTGGSATGGSATGGSTRGSATGISGTKTGGDSTSTLSPGGSLSHSVASTGTGTATAGTATGGGATGGSATSHNSITGTVTSSTGSATGPVTTSGAEARFVGASALQLIVLASAMILIM